jgi:hypothetical protein
VPVTTGGDVLTGIAGGGAAITAAVGALTAGVLDPPEFVATTETVSMLPTSAAMGT